ncbi:helix-turn-helix domain-containing protein [Porphyromonas gingivicanis]|uniref:helix-turn-helix domain-containing protein n=1 Tax=Porphyromonas gingivicanis TaxID=266762 RepID=UPI00046E77A8|nr:helix-turn-helix domain-containing protein [Porphyromonas gingivicanis]
MKKGEIGRKIKGCRIALDIPTSEVAKHLGITPQRLNTIERELDDSHTIVRYLQYLRDQGVDLNLIFSNFTNV